MNFFTRWQLQRNSQRKDYPAFVKQYLQGIASDSPSVKSKIADLRFVVLDTETTGLNPKTDIVLSIGGVAIKEKAVVVQDSLEIVLQTDRNFKAEAVQIHGLVKSDTAQGTSAAAAAEAFLAFLRADVIVAHHAAFDVLMLSRLIQPFAPKFRLYNPILDTAFLARKLDYSENPYGIQKHYDLDTLCNRFQIPMHDRHTAWGDAFLTAHIFLMLARRLEKQQRPTLQDFMRPIPMRPSF